MMKKICILVVALMILASSTAMAGDPSAWNKPDVSYGKKVFHKLTFGITNIALGWTELLTEPYEAGKSGENVVEGIGRGIWHTVADTVGGALHTVTFWCPKTDIPLPEGGIVLPCCK